MGILGLSCKIGLMWALQNRIGLRNGLAPPDNEFTWASADPDVYRNMGSLDYN